MTLTDKVLSLFRRGRTAGELRQEERRLSQSRYDLQQQIAGRAALRGEALKVAAIEGDDVAGVRELFDEETERLEGALADLDAEIAALEAAREAAGAAEAPVRMRELWEQLPGVLDTRDAAAAALGQADAAIAALLQEMGTIDGFAARARYRRKWPENWPVPSDSELNRLRALGYAPTFQRAPVPAPEPALTTRADGSVEVHDSSRAGGADMVRGVRDPGLTKPAA